MYEHKHLKECRNNGLLSLTAQIKIRYMMAYGLQIVLSTKKLLHALIVHAICEFVPAAEAFTSLLRREICFPG